MIVSVAKWAGNATPRYAPVVMQGTLWTPDFSSPNDVHSAYRGKFIPKKSLIHSLIVFQERLSVTRPAEMLTFSGEYLRSSYEVYLRHNIEYKR